MAVVPLVPVERASIAPRHAAPRDGLRRVCPNGLLWLLLLGGAGHVHAGTDLVITHGPILGRPGSTSMGVWARTSRPGSFHVRYGLSADVNQKTPAVATGVERDCTGWALLKDLKPDTRYYYQVVAGDSGSGPTGSFRTLPSADAHRHKTLNPAGLFNFRFEIGCGNNQGEHGLGLGMPTFKTMLDQIKNKVHFAILNGDFIYEDGREFSTSDWQRQTGVKELPANVRIAPAITGAWQNYKLYLERSRPLAEWHRHVPSFYTIDDHEILNDVNGCGETGLVQRRAVFRDIGVQAWHDYVAWSHPSEFKQGIQLGRADLEGGRDILTDKGVDFRKLDLSQAANLHIHWGTPDAGVNDEKLDKVPGDPNAGVYDIVEVLDAQRLRVRPAAKKTGQASYSIGRLNYFQWRLGNAHFLFLDTRSHRTLHDLKKPDRPGQTMLGARQLAWLKKAMADSDADVFFVVSSVNYMIPHDGSGGMAFAAEDKDDAWTAFPREREELTSFFGKLGRPVLIFTGDLHNSFAVKISDRVWEFASGPHNSRNHNAASEGKRPANGPYNSRGRLCDIRWSTYFLDDTPRDLRRQPVYLVVQLNNVFDNPTREGERRWVAYPRPHVVLRYHDGFSGDLLYAESIPVGRAKGWDK